MNKIIGMMLLLGFEIGLALGCVIGLNLMEKWHEPYIRELKEYRDYWFNKYIEEQTHKI